MSKTGSAILLILLIIWPGSVLSRESPAATTESSGGATLLFTDPFTPPLPAKTIRIHYRLTGRFEGREVLLAKDGLRISELEAVDTAYGLDRPVHLREFVGPSHLVSHDLISGRVTVQPNLRSSLSRRWQGLTPVEKYHLAKNLDVLGTALGEYLKSGVAVAAPAKFMGLPTVKVAVGQGRRWVWTGTDIPLKETFSLRGQPWNKEAIDVVRDEEIPDSEFLLRGITEPAVDPAEQAWIDRLADRIISLLIRPLVGLQEEPAETEAEEATEIEAAAPTVQRPIPWVHPAPPGYREPVARFQISPGWRPYPEPPGNRPWPPPGLGQDVLAFEARGIAVMIAERYPDRTIP
jgi:hypothetical protein